VVRASLVFLVSASRPEPDPAASGPATCALPTKNPLAVLAQEVAGERDVALAVR